jgi:chromate transport protein ChrA
MNTFTWYLVVAAVLVLPLAYSLAKSGLGEEGTQDLGMEALMLALAWPATIVIAIIVSVAGVVGKLARWLVRKK